MKWNQKLWTDGGRCTMAAAVECRRLLLQKLWWWWRWWSIYADGKTDRPPNDETSGRSAQSNLKSDGACNIIICRGNPGPPRSNRMHNITGRWACIYIGAANRPFRHTKKETHPPKKDATATRTVAVSRVLRPPLHQLAIGRVVLNSSLTSCPWSTRWQSGITLEIPRGCSLPNKLYGF